MSFTVAPATDSIMSAVPPGKAGAGSALNDNTREVGGALGFAIFGSASSALYRSAIDVRRLDLPPRAAQAAGESIGGANSLANHLPDGADLATRAGIAFSHAFTWWPAVCPGAGCGRPGGDAVRSGGGDGRRCSR